MIINFKNIGSGGGSGTSNYNDLSNKPKINNVELTSNKSLSDLGIQPELTAGENITIEGNVISATGGGSGLEVVDYADIDTEKALEIFAEPEKYVLVSEVDFSDPLIRIGRMPYFFISKNSTRVIFESGRIDDVQVEGQDYNDAYCLDIVITAEGEKNIQTNVIKNGVSPTKQYIDDLELSVAGALNLKQNILTAGTGIQISGDTISVTGGTGAGIEVVAFEDIDAAKGLEMYASPENYLINVDITDSEDESDAFIKTVGTTHTIYRYVGNATMQGASLRVYLCSLNGMIATYTKLILVAPDGSVIADQGKGVTDFTMPILSTIPEHIPDVCLPSAGAVKSYVDDLKQGYLEAQEVAATALNDLNSSKPNRSEVVNGQDVWINNWSELQYNGLFIAKITVNGVDQGVRIHPQSETDPNNMPKITELTSSTDVHHIVKITEADYEALVDKDSNTLYLIVDE